MKMFVAILSILITSCVFQKKEQQYSQMKDEQLNEISKVINRFKNYSIFLRDGVECQIYVIEFYPVDTNDLINIKTVVKIDKTGAISFEDSLKVNDVNLLSTNTSDFKDEGFYYKEITLLIQLMNKYDMIKVISDADLGDFIRIYNKYGEVYVYYNDGNIKNDYWEEKIKNLKKINKNWYKYQDTAP